jgi:hypothetical protein
MRTFACVVLIVCLGLRACADAHAGQPLGDSEDWNREWRRCIDDPRHEFNRFYSDLDDMWNVNCDRPYRGHPGQVDRMAGWKRTYDGPVVSAQVCTGNSQFTVCIDWNDSSIIKCYSQTRDGRLARRSCPDPNSE